MASTTEICTVKESTKSQPNFFKRQLSKCSRFTSEVDIVNGTLKIIVILFAVHAKPKEAAIALGAGAGLGVVYSFVVLKANYSFEANDEAPCNSAITCVTGLIQWAANFKPGPTAGKVLIAYWFAHHMGIEPKIDHVPLGTFLIGFGFTKNIGDILAKQRSHGAVSQPDAFHKKLEQQECCH